MPDHAAIEKQLRERLRVLEEHLEEIDDELREQSDDDFAERATELEGDEVLEGLGKAGLDEMAQIRAALVRLENGTFGRCASCGEPIAKKRLKAVPHASLCIDCAK